VGKILDHSSVNIWRFVRSEDNPVDLASRGIEAHEEEKWEFYHHGLSFLKKSQNLWPSGNGDFSMTDEEEAEVKQVKKCAAVQVNVYSLIDKLCGSCSGWLRLAAIVARLIKFKQFLVNNHRNVAHANITNGFISLAA
jgi:hypothetical protein